MMTRIPAIRWQGALAACLLAVACTASAAPQDADAGRDDWARIDEKVLTEGFLAAHPDLRWRGEALEAWEKKDYASAMTMFLRAASHADKPSQAVVADMYWRGEGVPQDRPLGYAWMDLAAERMYPVFLGYRENYWAALSPAEREEAIERGQALLAEYGDDVAKPRLEKALRRGARPTGSRTGFTGALTIIPNTGPFAGTGMTLSGTEYYAKKYWEPAQYWQLQDEIWSAPPRGKVDVGDVETVRGERP
jgi:hypothetical protein